MVRMDKNYIMKKGDIMDMEKEYKCMEFGHSREEEEHSMQPTKEKK